MTVVKTYSGINHELLCDILCDIIEMEGFSVICDKKQTLCQSNLLKARRNGLWS